MKPKFRDSKREIKPIHGLSIKHVKFMGQIKRYAGSFIGCYPNISDDPIAFTQPRPFPVPVTRIEFESDNNDKADQHRCENQQHLGQDAANKPLHFEICTQAYLNWQMPGVKLPERRGKKLQYLPLIASGSMMKHRSTSFNIGAMV